MIYYGLKWLYNCFLFVSLCWASRAVFHTARIVQVSWNCPFAFFEKILTTHLEVGPEWELFYQESVHEQVLTNNLSSRYADSDRYAYLEEQSTIFWYLQDLQSICVIIAFFKIYCTWNAPPRILNLIEPYSPDTLSLQAAKWSRKLASILGYEKEIAQTQIKQQTNKCIT